MHYFYFYYKYAFLYYHSVLFLFGVHYLPIAGILTGATAPDQGGPGNNSY